MQPRKGFLVWLGGLSVLGFLATDMYLPAFAAMQEDLQTPAAAISASLSLFLAGFAIAQLLWGPLSDRFGRKPVLIAMTLLALATAWPALTMLANAPSFLMMLSVLLWLSFIYGMYNGAMIPALTEIMPAEVRVAGFSLAYSLATAVFGGFTPVISTALIEYTGDKASPGYWMSFAAICGLLATCYLYRRSAVALQTAR